MVSSTQRHGELIADLSAECPALRKAQVVGIAGLAPANQTRLLGHMSDVIAVANPARLRQRQHTFVDHLRSRPVLRLRCRRALSSRGLLPCPLRLIGLGRRKARQSRLEALLHGLRIGCRQFVLFDERPMRPDCSIIAAGKIIEFAEKSIAQCSRRFWPPALARRDLIEVYRCDGPLIVVAEHGDDHHSAGYRRLRLVQ